MIINLVPRPPLFFALQFAFSIIHKSGRERSIHHVSGCKVDIGGQGLIFKYVIKTRKVGFLPDIYKLVEDM